MGNKKISKKKKFASLNQIHLCFTGFDCIRVPKRMRNYHAPVHIRNDIDKVTVVVETEESDSKIVLNRKTLYSGKQSKTFPLAVGKNVFAGSITSSDGKSSIDFNFKIFRAYPHLAWEKIADSSPWKARDSAGELVFKDRMWLFGGFIPALVNDVWSSDDGVNWTREADVPTEVGIDIPIAFVFKQKMWITDVNGVLYSSKDGKDWNVETDSAPWRGRSSAGSVVFGGKIWIMGGRKQGVLFNDIWSSKDGLNWILEVENAPWAGRMIHNTPLVMDNKIWLIGGAVSASDYHPFIAWNDVWCSSDGKNWECTIEHAPWCPRMWGSSAVYRNRLWLIGGFRSEPVWENLGDVWYSTDGSEWRQLETIPCLRHSGESNRLFELSRAVWERRHEQSAYVFQDSLWVVGGMVWPLVNDVWKLSIPGMCFVSQPPIETYKGVLYEYQPLVDFNSSRDKIKYRLKKGPRWLSIDEASGIIQGIAPRSGSFSIGIEAYDKKGEKAEQEFILHILSVIPTKTNP